MMQVACYGRLVSDPRSITTKSGKPMTVGRLVANLQTRNADGEAGFFLGIVAFGGLAERLAGLQKGAMVSVIGRCQLNRWESDQGPREELQVVVDEIVSARTVRPGTKPNAGATSRPAKAAPEPLPFDDPLPF